jgi:fumarate hydratase class I
VEDFPAYILVDDKGNDFFADVRTACSKCALSAYENARMDMIK